MWVAKEYSSFNHSVASILHENSEGIEAIKIGDLEIEREYVEDWTKATLKHAITDPDNADHGYPIIIKAIDSVVGEKQNINAVSSGHASTVNAEGAVRALKSLKSSVSAVYDKVSGFYADCKDKRGDKQEIKKMLMDALDRAPLVSDVQPAFKRHRPKDGQDSLSSGKSIVERYESGEAITLDSLQKALVDTVSEASAISGRAF